MGKKILILICYARRECHTLVERWTQLYPQSTDKAKPRKVIIQNEVCIFVHNRLPFREVNEKNTYLHFRTFMGFGWHSLWGVSVENSVKVLTLKFAFNCNWYFAYILHQTFASSEILTPCRRWVFLERLPKIFLAFYGTQSFIAVFTTARHRTPSQILRQVNQIHTLSTHFFKTQFTVILPYTPLSYQIFLLFRSYEHKFVCISDLSYACSMPPP
jgi:hypothetical protein